MSLVKFEATGFRDAQAVPDIRSKRQQSGLVAIARGSRDEAFNLAPGEALVKTRERDGRGFRSRWHLLQLGWAAAGR
jgi:hypothetical protein